MKKAIEKRFKNPFFPASFILAADILLLAFAAVARALRDKFTLVCSYTQEMGITEKCGADTAIAVAAVVALAAAAALAGYIFAGAALWGKEDNSVAFRITTGAVMLCLSAAAASFSIYAVRGEQPRECEYNGFIDSNERVVVIVEEEYSKTSVLKIYRLDSNHEKAYRLAALQLTERTQDGDFVSRYSISWISENLLSVTFTDNGAYRALSIPAEIPEVTDNVDFSDTESISENNFT